MKRDEGDEDNNKKKRKGKYQAPFYEEYYAQSKIGTNGLPRLSKYQPH